MEFIWDRNNLTHLECDGVAPAVAEAVFHSGCHAIHGTSLRWRFVLEAEVEGRTYRLFFDRTPDGERIYPVTCFPVH